MALLREIAAELFVMAAIGLVLGLLGPFGTYAVPIGLRVPAWLLLALSGYVFFRPVIAAGIAMHERTGAPRLAAIAIACALAAVPTAIAIALIFAWARIAPLSPERLADSYPSVLLIGAIATTIQLVLFGRQPATAPAPAIAPVPTPAPPTPPPEPRFLDRLPPALRHDLLCLEMEDHYVRAHGRAGSALILLRMRDAVDELGDTDGLRVHRSWWVARAAVAEVIRRDRAILLRLVNGLDVPVSRAAAPELRAAGWL